MQVSGKLDSKNRAALRTLGPQARAVKIENGDDDRKAEPSATGIPARGEKRLAQPVDISIAKSLAIIGNPQGPPIPGKFKPIRSVLKGVSTIPLSPTIFWNYWEWEISADDSLDAPTATPAATEETEG